MVIVTTEITEAQHELLQTEFSNLPWQKLGNDVHVAEIIDDNEVNTYVVAPDGSYIRETLEEGLHNGWTAYNENDEELEFFYEYN